MSDTIYWTLINSQEVQLEPRSFLSPIELDQFNLFRFPKRRDEWLLGRWAAKTLLHSLPAFQQFSLDQIEICNTPHGAPFINLPGQIIPAGRLTISHSGTLALCAFTSSLDMYVGADLEKIEPRTGTFVLDYFTPAEIQLVDTCPAETRAALVTLVWSTKESMLKALQVGLRWDTRKVEVQEVRRDGIPPLHPIAASPGIWQEIRVGETVANGFIQPASALDSGTCGTATPDTGTLDWAAWWQRLDGFILTLACYATRPSDIQSVRLVVK
jgi:4'-phosphopantetheinyl transferase